MYRLLHHTVFMVYCYVTNHLRIQWDKTTILFFSSSFGLIRLKAVFCLKFFMQLQSVAAVAESRGHLEQRASTNCYLQAKSNPIPVFVNKALLEHSHHHSFRYCLWLLPRCICKVEQLQQRPSRLHSLYMTCTKLQ